MGRAISVDKIENRIFQIRGRRVMLDKELAALYGVKPIALRQQVKRNRERFPEDFMFQLTDEEVKIMVSQNVIPSIQRLGGLPTFCFYRARRGYAFKCSTQQARNISKHTNYACICKS